ncbi:hypothetical protein [Paraburkholderia rhynchosiae]|uniref:Pilus assembly protein n=1 Tax=Paraburkholderia rhynchosiae TaxID=487049 RepID=A0A2N7W834_9BURK|nr:hypothetical protein [Paraburkholderia rhynchosiae]PMS25555.1 hypothetical protein C0Z16_28905 [Paraburkholderia rhynchosiae]CAB3734516.1 hypothetical protein LMG27174_06122 [Paraburkholderia rhynchosiae]
MTNRTTSISRWVALLVPACIALNGCLSTTPGVDRHFGESVRGYAEAQIIDPDAASKHPSTLGVDGKAAVAAMSNYHASLKAPSTSGNAFVIGVGGSAAGGSGAPMAAPANGE